ncbi:dolichol kinase [Battus philenor]|uniref:dolichol kinase n=1 Tax=Battus philenor TaxID=42288 RepID=UPI0035CEFBA3
MEGTRKLMGANCYGVCTNFVKSLDNQILTNLKKAGIELRPAKSIGLWCYTLLPMILLNYTFIYKTPVWYQTIAFVSVGLFSYCSLFILFLSITGNIILEAEYGGCMASGLISTILLYTVSEKDLLPSLFISLSCIWSFNILLKAALINFPKTFTLGEAMVVVQSIPLFVTASVIKFVHNIFYGIEDEYMLINTIVLTVLATTVLIIAAMFLVDNGNKSIKSIGYIVACAAIILLFAWHFILGPQCLIIIFEYVFGYNRLKLINFWLILLVVAVMLILIETKLGRKANTMTRKTFHILASMVFVSGILGDIQLMTLAAGIGLSVLLFVEAIRISGIEKISPALQSAFNVYGDEKDSGSFAMTPLYLFTGLACPLVLVPSATSLDLLAGVLAVGIGDTAASCAGASFGRTHWRDSNRTLEGTAFNILSQVALVYVLNFFDFFHGRNVLIRTIVSATTSALVEAKTEQVDNLILPLIALVAFQATWFLA